MPVIAPSCFLPTTTFRNSELVDINAYRSIATRTGKHWKVMHDCAHNSLAAADAATILFPAEQRSPNLSVISLAGCPDPYYRRSSCLKSPSMSDWGHSFSSLMWLSNREISYLWQNMKIYISWVSGCKVLMFETSDIVILSWRFCCCTTDQYVMYVANRSP